MTYYINDDDNDSRLLLCDQRGEKAVLIYQICQQQTEKILEISFNPDRDQPVQQ